ncbi:MAG: LUD domain-containing protein, partial [Marinirhabdus sp.]
MSLFRSIFGTKKGEENKAPQRQYLPEKTIPADETFALNFKKNGGKFLYCENWGEVLDNFKQILIENNWSEKEVYCNNQQLVNKFEGFNITFQQKKTATFFLSTCEAIIADNGAILFSSNQLNENKLNDLPDNFVVFAAIGQLVENLSEGLRNIKNKSKGQIPSNITTLRTFGKEHHKEMGTINYGGSTK